MNPRSGCLRRVSSASPKLPVTELADLEGDAEFVAWCKAELAHEHGACKCKIASGPHADGTWTCIDCGAVCL